VVWGDLPDARRRLDEAGWLESCLRLSGTSAWGPVDSGFIGVTVWIPHLSAKAEVRRSRMANASGLSIRGRHAGRRVVCIAFTQSQAYRIGQGRLLLLAAGELVANVCDRKLVTKAEPARHDAMAVDSDAVSAAQVLDLQPAANRGHTTMSSRDSHRIQLSVARRMATDHYHHLVDQDVWPFIQGQE
jgi:hypothetical protein